MLVFGVDLPLNIFLAVEVLLMMVGLVYVIWEIKKLRRLLTMEKQDLERFEKDLGIIEQENGKNVNDSVVSFVKKALESHITRDHIENMLLRKGWTQKQINDIFVKMHS